MRRRRRAKKVMAPVAELWTRPLVTVPEAVVMTGFSRQRVAQLCDEGEWRCFAKDTAKARRDIDTQSIIEWKNSKLEAASRRKAS